jgi:hypothetical protein
MGGGVIGTCAFAREEADKKGMDGSQITGAASSYARKYALNGLFCIDDTKDADTDEHAKNRQEAKGTPAANYYKTASYEAPPATETDDPGNYIVNANGKDWDGYTIRQIDMAKGGRDILLKMCNSSVPAGSPAAEIQQTVVRYLEKRTVPQDDEEPPF